MRTVQHIAGYVADMYCRDAGGILHMNSVAGMVVKSRFSLPACIKSLAAHRPRNVLPRLSRLNCRLNHNEPPPLRARSILCQWNWNTARFSSTVLSSINHGIFVSRLFKQVLRCARTLKKPFLQAG